MTLAPLDELQNTVDTGCHLYLDKCFPPSGSLVTVRVDKTSGCHSGHPLDRSQQVHELGDIVGADIKD